MNPCAPGPLLWFRPSLLGMPIAHHAFGVNGLSSQCLLCLPGAMSLWTSGAATRYLEGPINTPGLVLWCLVSLCFNKIHLVQSSPVKIERMHDALTRALCCSWLQGRQHQARTNTHHTLSITTTTINRKCCGCGKRKSEKASFLFCIGRLRAFSKKAFLRKRCRSQGENQVAGGIRLLGLQRKWRQRAKSAGTRNFHKTQLSDIAQALWRVRDIYKTRPT